MTIQGLHHLSLAVPDLSVAEDYYRELFQLSVTVREGRNDGRYGKLPDGIDWETAMAHDVDPDRSVLRREEFVLALTERPDADPPTRLDRIALRIELSDLGPVASRAASMGCGVEERESGAVITDRYGVEWLVTAEPFPPQSRYDSLTL